MTLEARPKDYSYDEETYPNVFTCIIEHIFTGTRWIFEISDWQNDAAALYNFVYALRGSGARMVGFNNVGFDYVVLHHFLKLYEAQGGQVQAWQLFQKAQEIIKSQGADEKYNHTIWDDNVIVPQLDLYKIHHFDNKAKSTSLKALEFNMRSASVQDLPFPVGTILTREQRATLIEYNAHDVKETIKFYRYTLDMIAFREELSAKYNRNFLNYNDTKIGKEYFIMELERAKPGSCYIPGTKKPQQTPRLHGIPLAGIIFPYIQFQHPEFTQVRDYLRSVTITDTKSAPELKNLSATVRGFQVDYGTGGLHGSVKNRVIRSTATHVIKDVDVASMYPNIAIVNKMFPQHLSQTFCEVYEALYNQRKGYKKGTIENAMLKLALNGVYGDSNNIYSPFYDPAYTMGITINGQLLLSMLADAFLMHPEFELIQVNTDGVSLSIPRHLEPHFRAVCEWWQGATGLVLEDVEYERMCIRDVNNYLAVDTSGKVKRKGAYQWSTEFPNDVSRSRTWSQDWSELVVPMAAEAFLVRGVPVDKFIYEHTDPFDFMIRAKVPRSSRLVLIHGPDTRVFEGDSRSNIAPNDTRRIEPLTENTVRYVIANSGPGLAKIMPPLAKKPDAERTIGINVGKSVALCNHVRDFSWDKLNRAYYVEEARKLTDILQ